MNISTYFCSCNSLETISLTAIQFETQKLLTNIIILINSNLVNKTKSCGSITVDQALNITILGEKIEEFINQNSISLIFSVQKYPRIRFEASFYLSKGSPSKRNANKDNSDNTSAQLSEISKDNFTTSIEILSKSGYLDVIIGLEDIKILDKHDCDYKNPIFSIKKNF